jgi:hypothetical protein
MAVNLTISKTVTGAQVSDTLAGASTGLDLGSVVNGKYCPIISQASNTGWQQLYIRHDATINEIDNVKLFVAQFSGTYGGAVSAAADFATLKAKGNADAETTANNNDGLASGLRMEQDADLASALGASAFLPSRAQVKIFGNSNTDGIDLASAFTIHEDAMTYWNGSSEVDATTPVAGKIGKSTDTVLGNRANLKFRFYLEQAAPDGGILQFDLVTAYSFTA